MRQCFLQWLPKNKENKLVQTFNSNIRYIDDILSLNNYRFADYLHRICPNEHGVKDTTDTQRSASYLAIDNRGRLKKNSTTNVMTSLLSVVIFQHHQRMEFTFHNSYVILERCAQYSDFMERAWLLTQQLLKQGYVEVIAAQIIWSSLRSGWSLRNIHISNDNVSFTFYVDIFFSLSLLRL